MKATRLSVENLSLFDIYFQVGLLATIGLAAKNAILIIEFAEAAVRNGEPLLQSIIEAAQLRLRPILMTSMAFGAGVIPLSMASGPGSASQHAIGTGLLGGVLSGTMLVIFFVPLFYFQIRQQRTLSGNHLWRFIPIANRE